MENERDAYPLAGATALEHLTGPFRGTAIWLSGSTLDISLTTNLFLRVSEARPTWSLASPVGSTTAHVFTVLKIAMKSRLPRTDRYG